MVLQAQMSCLRTNSVGSVEGSLKYRPQFVKTHHWSHSLFVYHQTPERAEMLSSCWSSNIRSYYPVEADKNGIRLLMQKWYIIPRWTDD